VSSIGRGNGEDNRQQQFNNWQLSLDGNGRIWSVFYEMAYMYLSMPITEESLKHDNNQSRKDFEQEIRDYGGGGKYLVAKSFFRGKRRAEDLEEDNVEICLQLTLL
jgi:hypothetical protein